MKRRILSVLLGFLAGWHIAPQPSVSASQFGRPQEVIIIQPQFNSGSIAAAIRIASELYVEIHCAGLTTDAVMGTGFPVSADRVLTAFHIQCGPEDAMLVTIPNGRVHAETVRADPERDLRLLSVDSFRYKHRARLRTDVGVGDIVVGRGAAMGLHGRGGAATWGIISGGDAIMMASTNDSYGGMSGSALVDLDGRVVGMSIGFLKDNSTGTTMNVAVTTKVIQEFLK